MQRERERETIKTEEVVCGVLFEANFQIKRERKKRGNGGEMMTKSQRRRRRRRRRRAKR